jgi:demethylsterigmatocystin 6-O-methyltransferase
MNRRFSCVGPVLQETPAFLAENKYQSPSDPLHLPFQKAFQTDLPLFRYMHTRPDLVSYFNTFMTAQRGDSPGWLSVYPIEEETKGWNPEEPVFVDVGGGVGHQCSELMTKYPELPGKIILEDLPLAIDNAVPLEGLRTIVHDFFTQQPIKGATNSAQDLLLLTGLKVPSTTTSGTSCITTLTTGLGSS